MTTATYNRETPKQAGLVYVRMIRPGVHEFRDTTTNKFEVWACSKNCASYSLIYKNTSLEFVSSSR